MTAMLDYFTDGEGNSPTLVLIHRGGMLYRMWEPQLGPLAARYHVVAPDLYYPGAWGAFTVERAAEDVLTVFDKLTAGPVVLVGMALGSVVALQIATTHPARVRGMVLGAPRVRVPAGAMRLNRLVMRLLPRRSVETAHVRQGRRALPDLSDAAAAEMGRLGRAGLLAVSRAMEGVDFAGALPALTMPIRVITGADAAETARAAAEVLARRAPAAELHVLPNARHWLNHEQPDAFTQAVIEFVDALPPEPTQTD